MGKFFVSLVSHCEKVWWDPGYDALRMAVRAMLDLQERVSRQVGYAVSSTFCSFVDHPTGTAVKADAVQAPEVLHAILSSGNEVGLHVHAPTGELHTGLQDRLIALDAELLAGLGFPRPVTYTAGDFVTSSRFVEYLEDAGFKVDCSVYNLEGAMDRFGARVDYTGRRSLRPYRPSCHDLCAEGSSSIIEIPVSGCLDEFGGQGYEHLPHITERIRTRYGSLDEGVDVFQLFWHPFDVVTLDGKDTPALVASGLRPDQGRGRIDVNRRVLDPFEEFLVEFGRQSGVEIASAIRAATCWESYGKQRVA